MYGVCDSGAYWGATIVDFVKNEMKMISFDGDPSAYYERDNERATEVLEIYVDDSLFALSDSFLPRLQQMENSFNSKPVVWDNIEFLWISIDTREDPSKGSYLTMRQPGFLAKIKEMSIDISFERFVSVRASVGWLDHTRPDICFSTS